MFKAFSDLRAWFTTQQISKIDKVRKVENRLDAPLMQYMQHNRGAEIFCTSKMGERLFKSRNCYQYIFALDIAKRKLAIFEVLWLFFAIKENRIKFFMQTFWFFFQT